MVSEYAGRGLSARLNSVAVLDAGARQRGVWYPGDYMPNDFSELSSSFRVTAFVDILGWGSLTEGIPTRVLRRMKRAESLDDHEKTYGERLVAQVNRARAIDDATRAILTGLSEICAPAEAVGGPGSLRQFWENQHVVFLRAWIALVRRREH